MWPANIRRRSEYFFGSASEGVPVDDNRAVSGRAIRGAGEIVLRYGLVPILLWIGGMKFTAFEAAAIQPLVASCPFMSWMYGILSLQAVSNLLGTVEITIAVMIAIRPWSRLASVLGSALAAGMFLTTLTFLVSLPGWEPALGGFPALSGAGGFLIKDVILLGAALWSCGDALGHANSKKGSIS